jgi:tetratricopeptide (TPR) repeat protein
VQPLEQVAKRLKGLIIKRPGMALGLWGEAGIGKTHTTHNLLQEIPCKNLSQHATTSISNLARALPKPKKLAVWVTRIFEKLEGNQVLTTEQTTSAFGVVLSGIAPFILHLEDVHEANPEQLEWIVAMAKVITRLKGVALVVTSRSEPPEPFEALRLEKLDFEAVKNLLENEAQASLPTEAMTWIHGKATGNPLFTVEFFRFLARQGFVWSDGKQWRWRKPERSVIPVTVEATIERVIAEAGSDIDTQMALKARAYLESLKPNLKLESGVWAHVANLEPVALERAERNLWAQGVMNETGFVHPLFREVSVNGLTIRERESFANRALEVLPLNVAGVCIVDAQLGPARSLEWLTRVADASSTPGRWLAAAVEFASDTERTRLALEAARALATSDLHQAHRLYRVALEGSTDPAVTLEFVTFLAPQRPDEARALFEALPKAVRMSAQGLVARFQMMVVIGDVNGIIDCWRSEFGSSIDLSPDALVHVIQSLKSLDHCDDAIRLADLVLSRSDLSPWQRARIMQRKIAAYGQSNRYVQALELTNRVLELLASHGLPRDVMLSNRAMYQMQLGDYRSAQADTGEAVRLAQAIGRTQTEMMNRGFLGELHGEFGDYALAEELLLEAFEYQVHHSVNEHLCDIVNGLTELYLAWRDRPSSGLLAQKYARLSLEYAAVMGVPTYLAASCAYAGFVELEYGSPSRALELALEALEVGVKEHQFYGRWFPIWLEAKAHIKLGDRRRALGLLEQTVAGFGQIGRVVHMNLAGFDLDRLRDDHESAQARLEWFQERGMLSSRLYGLRLFPELAETASANATEIRADSRLQVLGTMQILIAENSEPVRGRKRQELLALLLEARISGRSEVSKLELADKLYPDSDEIQANAGIHDVVYQLRSNLGESTITTTTNGYALGSLKTDVETFLETGNTQLWRGVYLEGSLLEVSDTVRESLYLALRTRAEALLETDPIEVARVGRLLCEADPYDLEALRLTVAGLRAGQNHRSLSRFYLQACTRLLEIGEVLPARWQEFLSSIGTTA